jgi:hypothetical protein
MTAVERGDCMFQGQLNTRVLPDDIITVGERFL